MPMREVFVSEIEEFVKELCLKANRELPEEMKNALKQAENIEKSPTGREILGDLLKNADLAKNSLLPICQDTGLAVVFIDIGEDAKINGSLEEAVNSGVRRAHKEGFLRNSVVNDPLFKRQNTNDNTPAILHLRFVPGNNIHITVAPKGGGCENKTVLRMLLPSAGKVKVIETVLEAVKAAGADACPPIVVGVGIGGSSELALVNSKRALLRPLGSNNPTQEYASLEQELLAEINKLGIGPQGFGGTVTALGVQVEFAPAHIASLPLAISISCHALRHAGGLLF